jgi:hypothetical protein
VFNSIFLCALCALWGKKYRRKDYINYKIKNPVEKINGETELTVFE